MPRSSSLLLPLLLAVGCSRVRSSHPLIDALRAGDADAAEQQLADGADVLMVLSDGSTALTAACQSGSLALVKTIASKGADLNAVDTTPRSVLEYCDDHIGFEAVSWLVSQGVEPSALITEEKAEAVFGSACLTGQYPGEEIEFYMAHGLSIPEGIGTDKTPPLSCATSRGLLEYSTFLLDSGATPDAADAQGVTPLMSLFSADEPAATGEHLALLLGRGATVNAVDGQGRSVLSHLRLSVDPALVRQLFGRGLLVRPADQTAPYYTEVLAPTCDGDPAMQTCILATLDAAIAAR